MRWTEGIKAVGICTVVLGCAWAASWLAGRLRLPVSRGLIFEGRWMATSWNAFPWLDCAGMIAFMVAAPLLLERVGGVSLRSVGFQFNRKAVLFTVAGLIFVSLIYLTRHAAAGGYSTPAVPTDFCVVGLYWGVVAAAEETIFRGFLQRRLTLAFGLVPALAVTALLFLLWHGKPSLDLVCVSRLAAAVGLGLLYRWSGLIPPIVCHWALNFGVTL